jgi:Flp pilus assembly protein TadD
MNKSRATISRLYLPALLAAGMICAILLAYSNHFHNSFHFDDAHTIQNNAFIRNLGNIPQFFRDGATFSSHPANQSYRPLVSTLIAISYALGHGLDPFWFHCSVFALFVCQVLLLTFVLHRLLDKATPSLANRWVAVGATSWYALHPANADTVNYIIACSDVISTLGIVASFACYFAFPRSRRFYLYALPAAVTVLAKPPAAVFALLFAAYRLLFAEPATRTSGRTKSYLREVVPVFLICGAALWFVSYMTPAHWSGGARDGWRYIATQPYAALLYFQTFLWPTGLSADYDLNAFDTLRDPRFLTGLGFLFCFLGGTVAASIKRETRLIAFGLWWFVIGLLPTSLLPLAEVMNDHRTFLPYIGLVVAAGGAASLVLRKRWLDSPFSRRAVAGLVVLFLCGNAYGTYERNQVWRTEETLWRDVVTKSPGNARGLMNYGLTLMEKGDYTDALRYYRQAQAIAPRYSILFVNLAIAEGATGLDTEAERDFREALRLAPDRPDSRTYYAKWLLKQSRLGEALALATEAVELAPGDVMARDLLAEVNKAVSHAPTPELFLTQSLSYYRAQRYQDSIAAARAALSLRRDYAEAWNNIGAAYNAMGNYEEAVKACEEALRLKPGYQLAANNLRFAVEHRPAPNAK